MINSFSENGFLIVKNAITTELLCDIQKTICNYLSDQEVNDLQKEDYFDLFSRKVKNISHSEYDFVKPIYELLFYKEFLDKIVLQKIFYNTVTDLLGKDLAFSFDPSLTLNLPHKSSPNENYLFKDWHQEIWSGASISSIQFWTPLFQKNCQEGQIEFIVGSHKWGHVPHRNRQPIDLPKKFEVQKTELEYGDVILFSTLLIHRSVSTNFPRLALPCLIKNFKHKDDSFQNNINWKIFSYSELTKIERVLGNHYLSPYRVLGLNVKVLSGTLKNS